MSDAPFLPLCPSDPSSTYIRPLETKVKLLEGDKLPPQVSELQGYWLLYPSGHCLRDHPSSASLSLPRLQLSPRKLVRGLFPALIQTIG